jgi:formate dehydrogenase major subunit
MGSNMAENHPVGYQWVMEAREQGAQVIHVDPRFTRTSATATSWVQIRPGTDVAFLGGIINYILENGREFREYVVPYTNAAVIIDERFLDTEDLDGFFSGWERETGQYDNTTWQYSGMEVVASAGKRERGALTGHAAGHGGSGAGLRHGEPPEEDLTLEHPRCVFQLVKKHFRRYTPELVAEVCGCRPEDLRAVAEALCANSGRERTSAIVYSVGWTQHTVGVQNVRAASIIQLLLGNMGRPGGGIMALRGHAEIQGSTDLATLYDILPGYIPMPEAHVHHDLKTFLDMSSAPTGIWGGMDAFMVSLMKAFWGPAATPDNDFCFDYLPKITGDHSAYEATLAMFDGRMKGYLLLGENPAVGSADSRLHRLALANLDWLVVRDLVEIESASFWYDSPEIESGELRTDRIPTEVFLMPAAAHVEKAGSFTNTQRLLQWREQAVEPKGDARSDLWFLYHLGRILRQKLADSPEPRDRPLRDLVWDYPTSGEHADPDPEAVLREINGRDADGKVLTSYLQLRADGSTACGCWIYSGCFAEDVNQAARKKPRWEQGPVAPEWGWAWPSNRRILYNRASADPEGNPWSERKRYVWWDAKLGQWTGHDNPDFTLDHGPDYVPPDGAKGGAAIAGNHPFILQADGRGWLFVPSGLVDGPLPAHFEPQESPFANRLYSQRANPARQQLPHRENPYHPSDGEPGAEAYPYVMTTYRLTEHHTAGGMSRTVAHLAELQPEMFCEVSPDLAKERGLEHGGWATIITARTAIEARVLVTRRMKPLEIQGRVLHQVGLPYHWGRKGLVTGDSANDLFPLVLDPNVHIQEVKAATCDIRPGRRPRDRNLRVLVESYPRTDGVNEP